MENVKPTTDNRKRIGLNGRQAAGCRTQQAAGSEQQSEAVCGPRSSVVCKSRETRAATRKAEARMENVKPTTDNLKWSGKQEAASSGGLRSPAIGRSREP